jgi:hypothetical protein
MNKKITKRVTRATYLLSRCSAEVEPDPPQRTRVIDLKVLREYFRTRKLECPMAIILGIA